MYYLLTLYLIYKHYSKIEMSCNICYYLYQLISSSVFYLYSCSTPYPIPEQDWEIVDLEQ